MYKYWIIVRTLLIEEMTNKNKEFITNKSNACNYEYMVEDKMVIEYLPILEQKDNKILTIGKIDRTKAHTNPPVLHATSIIVAVLPDGKIILTDKTEKQIKKGRNVKKNSHIYDTFGGHMTYESVPKDEFDTGLSIDTYIKCAYKELSEELLRLDKDGKRKKFIPKIERFKFVGLYGIENDHNKEISGVFAYFLEDYGPYASEDTLITNGEEENIIQPICVVDWEKLNAMYTKGKERNIFISDGIGRVLEKDNGEILKKYIVSNFRRKQNERSSFYINVSDE